MLKLIWNIFLAFCALKITEIECFSSSSNAAIAHNWTRIEKMDNIGIFQLQWYLDDDKIVFKAIVNSRGFIALGFTYPNANYKNKFDIALAWVDDRSGNTIIMDCYGSNSKFEGMKKDDTQNFIVESGGYQNLTHSVIIFKRQLETCDPCDVPLTNDTLTLFWGYGDKDINPTELSSTKFSNKGSRYIHILDPSFRRSADSEVHSWDVKVQNVSIKENHDTVYWCKIFGAPETNQKNHIIGFEPILNRNHKSLVHHMTLFECSILDVNSKDLDVWTTSAGLVCNSEESNSYSIWGSCITPVAAWSVGSNGQSFPSHVGIPLSGKYYMLEIFYNNPSKKTFKDDSGLRLYYTPKLRQFDAGVMINGVSPGNTQLVPPKQKLFKNLGICGQKCTSTENKFFSDDGINIISVSPWTHSAGKEIRLSHIRNDTELDPIIEDKFHNYYYQEVRQLGKEIKVLPNDVLITECTYDTQNRHFATFGGYSAKEEMCLTFTMYYPRINLVGCHSMVPVVEFFEYFGVKGFYGVSMTEVENIMLYGEEIVNKTLPTVKDIVSHEEKADWDEYYGYYKNSSLNKLTINDPIEFHDRTFLQHLNLLPWNDKYFSRGLEIAINEGSYMLFCKASSSKLQLSAEIIKYPKYKKLKKAGNRLCPDYIHYQELHSVDSSIIVLINKFLLVLANIFIILIL